MNYTETIARTEAEIDRILARQNRQIMAAIRKLEKKIIDLAAEILPVTSGGLVRSSGRSLAEAMKFHKQLVREFSVFSGVWERAVDGFDAIERAVLIEYADLDIPVSWTTADRKMFDALRESTLSDFQHFGEMTETRISQAVYDAVLVGRPFSALTDEFRGLLSGFEDVRGRSMASYAEVKAHDAVMDYYSRLNISAADEAGIDSMLWYGNIVKDSRPFCIARAGRVFTIEKIKSWDSMSWKGKKPGSTLINRGGYHCRHSLHPVMQEWVENGKIEVQNWHEGNNP